MHSFHLLIERMAVFGCGVLVRNSTVTHFGDQTMLDSGLVVAYLGVDETMGTYTIEFVVNGYKIPKS